MDGGLNTFAYVVGSPLIYADPQGLWVPGMHGRMAREAANEAGCSTRADEMATAVAGVDGEAGSQDPQNSHMHHMAKPGQSPGAAEADFLGYVNAMTRSCDMRDFAHAAHAWQDGFAPGHRHFQEWHGFDDTSPVKLLIHGAQDAFASNGTYNAAKDKTRDLITDLMKRCPGFCGGCGK